MLEDKFLRKDIKTPYEFGNFFSISILRAIYNSEEVVKVKVIYFTSRTRGVVAQVSRARGS